MSICDGASRLICESKIGLGKASNTGNYPAGFNFICLNEMVNFHQKVLPGFQPDYMNAGLYIFHGTMISTLS